MESIPQKNPLIKNLWLGIGCKSGISTELLLTAVDQVCRNYELRLAAIAGIATIDIKAREIGLVEFCRSRGLPLTTFPAEMLSQVVVPHGDMAIAKIVGTPSVAEAAAILAASQTNLAVKLIVPKQIIRLPEQPGAVTIAVAQTLLTNDPPNFRF
ncbi:cobalamin biosynthesis protein CbiG [Nostoc sp. CMAA1605]|nr:cobalamin biosynthesis protein CbiG [Nostoc sp. CMAA1605]